RNLYELSMIPGVRIIPPMLSYYHEPKSLGDLTCQVAARLLAPFGIETPGFRRWQESAPED
ncbi:MAG: aromatic acid decarboxylase, partial [Lachnospiraceae bacterium]|nr:aromatic acid decarboxylase [Lachnospiraceae bacterium]